MWNDGGSFVPGPQRCLKCRLGVFHNKRYARSWNNTWSHVHVAARLKKGRIRVVQAAGNLCQPRLPVSTLRQTLRARKKVGGGRATGTKPIVSSSRRGKFEITSNPSKIIAVDSSQPPIGRARAECFEC